MNAHDGSLTESQSTDKSMLLVDDDRQFAERLGRAMAARGYQPKIATGVGDGLALIEETPPAFAVFDIRLGDGNGLDLMRALMAKRPDSRAIILTGYGAIATAVAAVKLGAYDYLAKPANPDEIVAALTEGRVEQVKPPERPMTADRARWEHIQRVFGAHNRNVSETARQLDMHRRTLQRILAKRAPK